MGRPGFALQLYTLREPAAEDLAGTLHRVRGMGWENVQWSGMPDMPAEEIRAHLDAAGLRCVAGHYAVEPFEEDFAGALAFWQSIGAADVAPGGMMDDCKDTLEDWRRGAARLDALGARLKEEGMRLSYHNHAFEFETFPGDSRAKLDIVYEATAPAHLYAELDTAWVYVGGADPAAYLRRYAGRCPVIHMKDVAPEPNADGDTLFAALGQGLLDWPGIFEAGREAEVEWYVYEQDNGAGDLWEDIHTSFEFLSKNLK